jgi:outer membrane murein-binding lipoprotein Lpp
MLARILSVGACVVAATALAGCGSTPPVGSGTSATVETEKTATEQTTTEPTATEPNTAAPPQVDSAQQWAMPNLVGSDLQQAQDQIQSLTGDAVFYTSSHDLSGQNRNQVLDANWQVCSQNVAPGTPVTTASAIDFGVVKLAESCP